MSGSIYLIQNDGELVEMTEHAYDSEDLLQRLLASHPKLLGGEQIDHVKPRRWLLISRELGIDGDEVSVGRIDHIFIDQDGIPTLVEVKRSTDTRIRREVVGQMLDYAANAVAYASPERFRSMFEAECQGNGLDPEQYLQAELGLKNDADVFWDQVKTNLRAGKIRMIFVADEIPPQLRRIVEFLNEQMDPAEVLAVEIRQYVGEGIKSLVPRVVGRTAESEQKKSGFAREKRQWDELSFFEELAAKHGPGKAQVARAILEWSRRMVTQTWWGKGIQNGSFVPVYSHHGTEHTLLAVRTSGRVEIYFHYYQRKPPFDSIERRLELLERVNAIPGISIPADRIDRLPSISLSVLEDEESLKQFLGVYDWVIAQIKRT